MKDDKYTMIPNFSVTSQVQILSEKLDYNHKMMNIPEMWKTTLGSGIKIAILDTGLPEHIDLSPQGSYSVFPGYLVDRNGHGTHCGGIIAAIANNGMGVAGIAPEIEDYYAAVLDANGSGGIPGLVKGIRWAVDTLGADIISMSLGISSNVALLPKLEAACNYAVEQGTTIFAAAGNEYGGIGQPAKYDSVIAVAAVNSQKEHADFSNFGPEIDFAAGGVQVYSTYLNNSYAKLSGTSMACPALAAVGGLILAKHKEQDVILTPDQLREHIKRIAYDVGPTGFDELYGHGIPIFGHNEDNQQPAEDDVETGKQGWPQANCLYWKLARNFVNTMSDSISRNGTLELALMLGIKDLAKRIDAADSILKKSQ